MKIAVMTWRAWSAAHRYKSLLTNAKALGHEVICAGSRWPQSEGLIKETLKGMGIPYYPSAESIEAIKRFEPDVIFGEAVEDHTEHEAHLWAEEHGKVNLALDHAQVSPVRHEIWDIIKRDFPHMVLMVANKEQEARAREEGLRAKVVGLPGLDLIQNQYDVKAIRAQLGLQADQPLIGFFLIGYATKDRYLQSTEWELLGTFFRIAKHEGWKVVIHCHASERWAADSDGPEGLNFPNHRYMYLRWLQDQGGYFITDFAPGKIGELEFHLCDPYALISIADCVMGTTPSIAWKALVMGKKYVYFQNPDPAYTPYAGPWSNVIIETSNFEKTREMIEQGANSFKADPKFLKQEFYKLDKQAWRRMLDLAEELVE